MSVRASFPLPNTTKPSQGPVGLIVPFDFTAANQITGDLALEQMQGMIDFVQTIFIDNRFNTKPFTITFAGLQYTIQCRAGRQGIFPVICGAGALAFTAVSTGAGIVVPTIMMNAEQPYFTWDI